MRFISAEVLILRSKEILHQIVMVANKIIEAIWLAPRYLGASLAGNLIDGGGRSSPKRRCVPPREFIQAVITTSLTRDHCESDTLIRFLPLPERL